VTFLLAALTTLAGLAILAWSGDRLVAGAAALATRLQVSRLFIGIVIVGFGTSLPEVMATISAARLGEPALALGNIVGSNIANVGLILSLVLILSTRAHTLPENRRDWFIMLIALAGFSALMMLQGDLGPRSGLWLLGALSLYLWLSLRQSKNGQQPKPAGTVDLSWLLMTVFILGGLAGLALGAELLVNGATSLARFLGVSEKVIGITLVAVGTSLPELAAAIAAARQNAMALTVGNILGSNVFNVLAAAGASSLFLPLPLGDFGWDLLIMLAFSVALFPLFTQKARIPFPVVGISLLGAYAVYTLFLFWPCAGGLLCTG
jgi:cation:H+ antiporter